MRFVAIPETTARSVELLNYHGYRAFGATEEQTRALIEQLDQLAGAEVTVPPNVTTLSGRRAQLQVATHRSVVFPAPNSIAITHPVDNPVVTESTNQVLLASGRSAICGPFRCEIIRNPSGEAPGSPRNTRGQSEHSPAPAREMRARFVILTATHIDPAGNRIK